MHIEVIASVAEARSEDLLNKTVIVIDVLRATSNIVTALAHGCLGIVPIETVQQAKLLHKPEDLLGGERFGRKLAGFHLGNSPLEYGNEAVRGKRILMTTTNGTRAVHKSQKAQTVLIASFLNASAAANAAWKLGKNTVVLCAGTQDDFSLEDGLCAGLVVDVLADLAEKGAGSEVNDFGKAMRACYLHNRDRLEEALFSSHNGKRLVKMGFGQDVKSCAYLNVYDLVPVLKDGMLIPLNRAADK